MKKIFIYLLFLFLILIYHQPVFYTVSDYFDESNNSSNVFSTQCWEAPLSPTLIAPNNNSSTNASDVNFSWQSTTSSCPIAVITYRFQLDDANDFTSPLITTPFSNDLSYFYNNIPEGEYWWRVQAEDQYGNVSTSETYYLIVDRTTPFSISLSITGSYTKKIEEKIINGDFETSDLSGWTSADNVEILSSDVITDPDTIVIPPDGSRMVRIGNPNGSGNYVWENRLMGSFDAGAKSFSLNYNFFSRDYNPYDDPGFFIRLNGQEIFKLNTLAVNPFDQDDELARSTGWSEFYYDLSNHSDSKINLSLYAGNTGDQDVQSWVYVDKITTYFVSAPAHAIYTLTGDDNPGGSGINHFEYNIDGLGWQDGNNFGNTPPLSLHGNHTIQYRSVDNAGNYSPIYTVRVITDNISPNNINDLAVKLTTENTVTLTWSAPGNDGSTGRASQYDIRYSSTSTDCSGFNFDTATKVEKIPSPQEYGKTETLEVLGLNPQTKYCFAIKSADEAPNWSTLSNVVLTETTSGQVINVGDIVINELMWMGSSISNADEWIELRNMTDRTIDLSNFKLTKLSAGSEQDMAISFSGKSIAPQGYFLIANGNSYAGGDSQLKDSITPDIWDNSLDLSNTTLQIKLYWNDGTTDYIIDTAWNGETPTEGLYVTTSGQEKYYSMERTSIPGDGTNPLNWYTCIDEASTIDFFDGGADERGTPRAPNRSENEPLAHQKLLLRPKPAINLTLSDDKKTVSFAIKNITNYLKFSYELTYNSYNQPKGVIGSDVDLNGITEYTKQIDLATCSADVCTYDKNVNNIKLVIILIDQHGKKTKLEKTL